MPADAAGLTYDEWSKYRGSVKNFRDKLIVHTDPFARPESVPDMTPARSALLAGYGWIRTEIEETGVKHDGPENLDTWAENLSKEATAIVEAAVAASKDFDELH